MRIGIDLDDTLCDFVGPLNNFYDKGLSLSDYVSFEFHKIWNLTYEEAQNIIRNFIFKDNCKTLEPHENAYSVLRVLKNTDLFEFYIVSARDISLFEDTKEWIDLHFPNIFSGIVLCNTHGRNEQFKKTKTEVCKELGIKFFIDDLPHNILCPSIHTIAYSRPWNENNANRSLKCWKEVVSHLVKLPEKLIIGFSGKIGSGKDTAFDIVKKYLPFFQQRLFALRVKETVAAFTRTSLEMNLSRKHKAYVPPGFPFSLGRLQQIIGMSMRRDVDENIWINCVLKDPELPNYTIITDVRFPNEVIEIEKEGGLVIRINGDPAGIRERNEDGRDLNDISETALDDFEFEYAIENDGSLEDFEVKIMRIILEKLLIQ